MSRPDRRGHKKSDEIDVTNQAEEFDLLKNEHYGVELHTANLNGENDSPLKDIRNSDSHLDEKETEFVVDLWSNDLEVNIDTEQLLEGNAKKNSHPLDDQNDSFIFGEKQESLRLQNQSNEVSSSYESKQISTDQETAEDCEKLNEIHKEQWELAALGEWSLICHDDDDDDEELTNCYIIKDEFEKEQEVRQNLQSIIFQFQDVHVVQYFQKMLTLPGCQRDQIEKAIRQYGRLCRGHVPLCIRTDQS